MAKSVAELLVERLMDWGVDTIFGFPGDGLRLKLRGIDFYRVEDGRIVESWHVEDMLGLMMQMGVSPMARPGPMPPRRRSL